MVFNTINSAVIIAELLDRYNIKSNDFIQRCPNWIDSCLEEIKCHRTLETDVLRTRFTNNRVQLPKFTKAVDWVVIDEVKAHYNEDVYVLNEDIYLNRNASFSGNTYDQSPKFATIISMDNNPEIDPDFADRTIPRFYRVAHNWVHTNVKFGFIEIKYKYSPYILDDLTGLEFPLIPDEVNTKEAVMWYIIRTIVMRGYIHPILRLDARDTETNPALAFRKYATLSRISLNSPNLDERKKYTKPLSTIVGTRAKYHVDPKPKIVFQTPVPTPNTPPTPENTVYPDVYVCVSYPSYDFNTEVRLDYRNKPLSFNSPLKEEYNYLFIIVPEGRDFTLTDSFNQNLKPFMIEFGSDDRGGSIYRLPSVFATRISSTFVITLL